MSDDESDFGMVPANKKLTMYVIDGSEKMFEGGEECAFRVALKVVFHQLLKVCCSGSLSHMVGIIVTNTETTQSSNGQMFCYEWLKLSVPSDADVREVKELIDSEVIHEAFKEKFGGHATADLGNVMWSCKKLMSTSATSFRHHVIIYLTNNNNPFIDDPKSYDRLKRIIDDFCCTSYKDRNGLRKINKTPGEFHIFLLQEDGIRDKWLSITPNVFTGSLDELDLQAYKRTFSQRAFSNLDLEIGPGIKLGVSVYTLSGETRPPTKVKLDSATEAILERRTTYVPTQTKESKQLGEFEEEEEEEDDTTISVNKQPRSIDQIQKSIKVGGESIVWDSKKLLEIAKFDTKGIVVLGFKPISDIYLTDHIQPGQFLYPNDDKISGSTKLYRALLDKCIEKEMGIICRFCSRSNQKIRLVALVPEDKKSSTEIEEDDSLTEEEKEKKIQEVELVNEYRHKGFHVVFLPFTEDYRDVKDKLENPAGEPWPEVESEDVDVTKKFIHKLTRPYVPENFYNPRLKSFNALLIASAVGEETEREDTLLPYHKLMSEQAVNNLTTPLMEHFDLNDVPTGSGGANKRKTDDQTTGTSKRSKAVDLSTMDLEDVVKQVLVEKMTVSELKAAIATNNVGYIPKGAKKADLVDIIKRHYQ